MDRKIVFATAIVACALAAGFYFYLERARHEAPQAPPHAPAPAAPTAAAPAAPAIQYPVPPAAQAPSLPTLEMSDTSMRELLAALVGRSNFEDLFVPRDIIRRIVATVDNLPRERAAQRLMPLRAAPGPFVVAGEGDSRTIAEGNAARYRAYVAMAEAVDPGALAAAYFRMYPLFQQAYRDLGYPEGYFNDRLIAAIDDLLAAPQPAAPVRLAQRKVLYEFADSELEARSAGQKIMMRIGAQNADRLKARLRALREQLARPPAAVRP